MRKNLVHQPWHKKYLEVDPAVWNLCYITFDKTYLIMIELGNWYWTQKIIARNNEQKSFKTSMMYKKI